MEYNETELASLLGAAEESAQLLNRIADREAEGYKDISNAAVNSAFTAAADISLRVLEASKLMKEAAHLKVHSQFQVLRLG